MPTPTILILTEDRFHADVLSQTISSVSPNALCVLTKTILDAQNFFATSTADLFLPGVGSLQGDILELLYQCTGMSRRARTVFVVTGRRDYRFLSCLKKMPISGVFDPSSETLADLTPALHTVLQGKTYWSKSAREAIEGEVMSGKAISRMLTPKEQLIFSVIGDGSDDEDAAAMLRLKPSYIQSVRRTIHRKLGLQQRSELVRMAIATGYVQITSDGVTRPGFAQLLASCHGRS